MLVVLFSMKLMLLWTISGLVPLVLFRMKLVEFSTLNIGPPSMYFRLLVPWKASWEAQSKVIATAIDATLKGTAFIIFNVGLFVRFN